jgi:type IV pilus assembly protein PilV
MRHYENYYHKRNHINGFSLLEVLIALVVLSIGLLGIAALQANSLKANQSAYQRTQAIFLAYDMMDRMRANRTAALAGQYDIAMGLTLTGSTLAVADTIDWQDNLVGTLLPSGQGSVDCTTTITFCTVIVQWDESRVGGSATAASDIVSFSFTAAI